MTKRQSSQEWLGSALRRLRRDAGLTIEQLAGQIGCSKSSITRWESGQLTPAPDNLIALATIFGIPTWEFVPYTPKEATLAHLRWHSGLSLADVEDAFTERGLSRWRVGPIERGSNTPTPQEVAALSELFKQDSSMIYNAVSNTIEEAGKR